MLQLISRQLSPILASAIETHRTKILHANQTRRTELWNANSQNIEQKKPTKIPKTVPNKMQRRHSMDNIIQIKPTSMITSDLKGNKQNHYDIEDMQSRNTKAQSKINQVEEIKSTHLYESEDSFIQPNAVCDFTQSKPQSKLKRSKKIGLKLSDGNQFKNLEKQSPNNMQSSPQYANATLYSPTPTSKLSRKLWSKQSKSNLEQVESVHAQGIDVWKPVVESQNENVRSKKKLYHHESLRSNDHSGQQSKSIGFQSTKDLAEIKFDLQVDKYLDDGISETLSKDSLEKTSADKLYEKCSSSEDFDANHLSLAVQNTLLAFQKCDFPQDISKAVNSSLSILVESPCALLLPREFPVETTNVHQLSHFYTFIRFGETKPCASMSEPLSEKPINLNLEDESGDAMNAIGFTWKGIARYK